MSIKRFGPARTDAGKPAQPFARAVQAAGWLYVSGQTASKDGAIVSGGITAETRQAIENVVAILKEAGYGVQDVVRVGVWLDDPRDFAAFNAVYLEFFGEHLPARACVQSHLMVDGKIEIDCVAYRPEQ